MNVRVIRLAGVACTALYATFVVWVYVNQPRTIAQVTGGVASTVGAYRIDQAAFDDGLRLFHADKFPEARASFETADPAQQDARTQFYVAYSYYRQGWGRVYIDDDLFRSGLDAANRAIAVGATQGAIVDDPSLGMSAASELRAEFERGLAHGLADLNPMRLVRPRK